MSERGAAGVIGNQSEEARRELRDRELFDRIADSYARKDVIPSSRIARGAIVRRAVRPLLECGGDLGTVVDVGCGVGAQAMHLKGCFRRYIGVDYSSGLIEIGRELLRDLPGCELIAANIKAETIPGGVADTILVVGALHHMTDLKEVMDALRRIAKPNAQLVAIEPQSENSLIQGLRWVRKRIDSSYSSEQRFFSRAEMLEILNASGIRDPRVEFQGFITPPLAQVVLRPQWLFQPISRGAARLERHVERILPGWLSWNLVAYGRFGC